MTLTSHREQWNFEDTILAISFVSKKFHQNTKRKRRGDFVVQTKELNDPLPLCLRHVRNSEKKVKVCIYLAITNLIGIGLSIPEAQKAVKVVSNRVFGRYFKVAEDADNVNEELSSLELDTLPNER